LSRTVAAWRDRFGRGGHARAVSGSTAVPSARLGPGVRLWLLVIALLLVCLGSFPLGKYPIDPGTVVAILASRLLPIPQSWTDTMATVVVQVRLPRVLGALVVGAALASAGAAYQTIFRNPLVSPDILGVSAGAGFGAALAITLNLPWWAIEACAFGCGLLATGASFALVRRVGGGRSPIVLVLGGVVIAAFCQALISTFLYFADPLTTLPAITFWLLGGLGRVTLGDGTLALLVILPALAVLFLLRWPINVLALGQDDARTLGVAQDRVWLLVVVCATLMTAAAVSISGIVGWVGLLVPHMARMLVGAGFPLALPAAALLGATFLVAVDTVARNALYGDLPLGILTALLGAPFFLLLLVRTYGTEA